MTSIESEMNNFVDNLNSVIPTNIKNDYKIYIIFNLLLVKYNERPSMLIDSQLVTDQLLGSQMFMSFIENDIDLSFQILATETDTEELWILNIRSEQLFTNQKLRKINKHMNRGSLLGYPCAGYFEEAYTQDSLMIQMFIKDIEDIPVYSYICPLGLENEILAVKKWHRFNNYAIIIGWRLRLNIYVGLL